MHHSIELLNEVTSDCRLGDQIACVNGTSLLNVAHAIAVKTLKESGHNIELVKDTYT